MTQAAVVTDSSADLDPATACALGVRVVPMVTYADGGRRPVPAGCGPAAFWERTPAPDSGLPVRTAQPTPGDFCRTYRDIAAEESVSTAISIHPSARLSGAVQSAHLAADRTPEIAVLVIDSHLVGPPVGYVAREAGLAGDDHEPEALEDFVYSLLSQIDMWVYAAALGQLTQLEPEGWWNRLVRGVRRPLRPNVFHLREGEFRPVARVRDAEEAAERLTELAVGPGEGSDRINFVGTMFAGDGPDGPLFARVREALPAPVELENFIMGPVLGAHLGRGSLGVFTVAG